MTISVIIPTASDDRPRTLRDVPDDVATVVVREGNRAEARNLGAGQADGEVLVFADDDLGLPDGLLDELAGRCQRGTVIGLRDYDFGLLLTRLLVVHRADFARLGGLNPGYNHMEDTEFSLRALECGLDLERLPRSTVSHEPHDSAGQGTGAIIRNTTRLLVRYPWAAPRLVGGLAPVSRPDWRLPLGDGIGRVTDAEVVG